MTREEEIVGFKAEDDAALTAIVGPGFIACTCIGVAPLGEIWLRRRGAGWEARQHVQILASGPGDEECEGWSPFDVEFVANYARGVGLTQRAAISALVADRKRLADGLFG